MAKVYGQTVGGQPHMAGSVDRTSAVEACALVAVKGATSLQRGAFPSDVVGPDGGRAILRRAGGRTSLVGYVWFEPSADHLADVAVPDFCRAPAGAPDIIKPRVAS